MASKKFETFAQNLRAALILTSVSGANTNRNILANKGYLDEREAQLSKQGWRMHIQRKGNKNNPIADNTAAAQSTNRQEPCAHRTRVRRPGPYGR